MEQQIKNKRLMLQIIGVAILVIGLVGITYAFFNYTRIGSANIIRTGRINFSSEQGTSMNLTNIFPVDVSEGIPNNATKVGSVTINVTGDTTYGEGVEYLVSAVNVNNTSGSGAATKSLPISIDVAVSSNIHGEAPNQTTTTLGTAATDYFEDRGSTTSYYYVLAGDTIEENSKLVVGYIAPGVTGIDGNIVIRAYLDASKVAISDTYPGQTVRTVITTNYSSNDCETVLTGVQDASTYCATAADLQDAIDGEDLTDAQINALVVAGIVEEYTDGTTSEWVGERVVFTTSEWNSLQTNGVSFQIKVEANEGIWVLPPAPTIPSCPGCKFMYTTNIYQYGGVNNANATMVSSLTGVTNDYTTLNQNTFLGFTETSDGKIDRAFACGIKGEAPNQGTAFCIEGAVDDSTFVPNKTLLNELYGIQIEGSSYGCYNGGDDVSCYGSVYAYADLYGLIVTSEHYDNLYINCYVYSTNEMQCD